MEVGGTGDLRAVVDLPLALQLIGRPRDPQLRRAVAELRAWVRAGGLRKDANGDGVYEHADAIRILDAWWPRWVRAEFRPTLGRTAYSRLTSFLAVDNPPNNGGQHLGSAYQGPFYGFVSKDLRRACAPRARALRAAVLRTRLAGALPAAAAELAQGGPRGPVQRRLSGRRRLPRGRPALLRLDPPAPGRRRDPAADRLDQPPDVPAGKRDPAQRAALTSCGSAVAGDRLRDVRRAPRRP